MTEIKSCPNCGGKSIMISRCVIGTVAEQIMPYQLFCTECNWYGKRAFTRHGAAIKWNKEERDG